MQPIAVGSVGTRLPMVNDKVKWKDSLWIVDKVYNGTFERELHVHAVDDKSNEVWLGAFSGHVELVEIAKKTTFVRKLFDKHNLDKLEKFPHLAYLCLGIYFAYQALADVRGFIGFIAGALVCMSILQLVGGIKEGEVFKD